MIGIAEDSLERRQGRYSMLSKIFWSPIQLLLAELANYVVRWPLNTQRIPVFLPSHVLQSLGNYSSHKDGSPRLRGPRELVK